MNYEDTDDLRSSFTTYLAEGDKLFSNGEYKKALEAYTKALMLKPGDKSCLVSRSKCYLNIGDPESALKDADECIKDDKTYHKGLYQRAEALYQMGHFEHALMYFHRGHTLRPELGQFRLGIQKCQEAIENSVGSPEVIKLDTQVQIDQNRRKTMDYRQKRHFKEEQKRVASEKTAKALLGELYVDREYLECLANDEMLVGTDHGKESIGDLINAGIRYLDNRTDFWRQQKPMYTRKREKSMLRPITSESISRQINTGMKAMENEDFEVALQSAINAGKTIETHPDKRKSPHVLTLQADINQLYGKALLELGRIDESIQRHKIEVRVGKQSGISELKIRGMDNLAEAYVKNQNFDKAMRIYSDRVKLAKSGNESAWLYHNWGRCLLEQADFDGAENKGLAAHASALEVNDKQWQLNSKVLVAQAQLKSGKLDGAEASFNEALTLAKAVEDEVACNVIQTQLSQITTYNESLKMETNDTADQLDDTAGELGVVEAPHEDEHPMETESPPEESASEETPPKTPEDVEPTIAVSEHSVNDNNVDPDDQSVDGQSDPEEPDLKPDEDEK